MKATYTVKVHVDADGDMVIIQNPTLAPAIEKSDYEPKTPEADASLDADTVNDATAFLETFFKLYPTATEKELDRKSTRLNSSHITRSRMPSSA